MLHKIKGYQSKEQQFADSEKYSDEQLYKCIEFLKDPEINIGFDKDLFMEDELEEGCVSSCTMNDYSPSHPWDAHGHEY